MENVKEFLKYLKKTDTKVLNLDDFLNELKNTPERDFTGTLKTNMLSHKDGLISVDIFLKNLFQYEGQGHFLSNSEIKELENDTDYVYDDDESYLTNKDSFLAHNINMNMFINNENNYLVFLHINTKAYIKGGFSSYVAMKFNTKKDYEYTFLYDSIEYELGSCQIEAQDGTTATVEVVSSPFDYPANMYAIDDDTYEEIFLTEVGCADFSSIKYEVNDYISNDKKLSKKFHDIEFDGYDGNIYIAN